jgi:hypothetical protein
MQKANKGLFIYSTGGKCRHIMNKYYIYSQLFFIFTITAAVTNYHFGHKKSSKEDDCEALNVSLVGSITEYCTRLSIVQCWCRCFSSGAPLRFILVQLSEHFHI